MQQHTSTANHPDRAGGAPRLEWVGQVGVIDLGPGENRFAPAWLAALDAALGEIESRAPAALVTCASGTVWSNGLDLDWFESHDDQADAFLREVQRVLARVLLLPVPTVAAVTGHAFAAGAILAICHDHAVMRADRGYWCCPEVTLQLPFTPG
jgi:enoyl-CoA hydratase/carnithine racemase